MLKEPSKYTNAGAKLINSILQVGQPGTCKTLLALAREAGVKSININASELDKTYVIICYY